MATAEKWITDQPKPHGVYEAIAAVMAEIGKAGISKDRKNTQQNYAFRGIDDVYNALSPLLAKHKLVVLPRVISRECVERVTTKGSTLFYVTLAMEFDLVCATDGSKHTVAVSGEAMDSADKATNKAMSAAFKYACMQVFCIPTEGDNDADATTHQVAPQEIDEDVWTVLADAASEGRTHLQDAWKQIAENTRTAILTSHRTRWEAIKAKAA